jgi:hypothetical protein
VPRWHSELRGGGGFVVTWQAYNYGSSDYDLGIGAQMFGADGNKLGGEFLVNLETRPAIG